MYSAMKRMIDFILSLMALVALLPLFFLVGIVIKLDSKGPLLFQQKRVGKERAHFYIYKFRTMKTDTPRDMPTHLLKQPELYITKTGRFLRKSSLDELPQIINILKGEMSIIGPRPALWNQADLIAEREKHGVNQIRPGLTGWAQVNGRDELPVKIKAQLDGEYVKNASPAFDMKILFKTIACVLKANGHKDKSTTNPEEKKFN